jgi:mRNA-degrading endonuclease RelE of RelBE toxin-antitoxin system
MKRRLLYSGRFLKGMKRLPRDAQARIVHALERYAITGDGDVAPLRGEFEGSYRLRVGKWRIFLLRQESDLIAYRIDNRGEAY